MRTIARHHGYTFALLLMLCWGSRMAQAATSYLFFDISVWHRASQQHDYTRLMPEGTLHSGDRYKIQVIPKNNGYLYIFQQDSSGKLYRLFPMERFGNTVVNNFNPVRQGIKYMFPGQEKAFVLDAQVGRETLYFLASSERDVELDAPYQEDDRRQELQMIDALINLAETTTGLTPPPSAEHQEEDVAFAVLQQRIQRMCQGCVYVLPFLHH